MKKFNTFNTFNTFCKNISLSVIVAVLGTTAVRAADSNEEPMMRPGPEKSMPSKRGGDMREQMAKHHAHLHDKLKLNAEQEAAWKTYTAAIMKKPEDLMHPDHAQMAALSAPQKMEKMIEMMQKGTEHMQAHLAALKTFYAALTPEQQAIFNKGFHPHHHPQRPMMRQAPEHNK